MPTVSTKGATIAYADSGPRDAPAVAFLHALGAHSGMWSAQVEAALATLVPTRRIVVRMSLAGYDRAQIVERTGWSEAKVRNLLSRGMEDLRTQLRARRETEESHD